MALSLEEAKQMIEILINEQQFDEVSIAKAIGAYPKTVRSILNLSKDRLSQKQATLLIELYCRERRSSLSE